MLSKTLSAPRGAPLPQSEAVLQNQLLTMLTDLPVGTAIGVACSFLLHCSYNHHVEFRRVMNEKVIREGFRGMSLLEMFKRESQ
jgi:hypothetical protein